jgi:hypothetical protein
MSLPRTGRSRAIAVTALIFLAADHGALALERCGPGRAGLGVDCG